MLGEKTSSEYYHAHKGGGGGGGSCWAKKLVVNITMHTRRGETLQLDVTDIKYRATKLCYVDSLPYSHSEGGSSLQAIQTRKCLCCLTRISRWLTF